MLLDSISMLMLWLDPCEPMDEFLYLCTDGTTRKYKVPPTEVHTFTYKRQDGSRIYALVGEEEEIKLEELQSYSEK